LLQLTPLACKSSLNVDRQVFFGRPLFLLPSAGVHSVARWAGRSGAWSLPTTYTYYLE